MLGYPKYKRGDTVRFTFPVRDPQTGEISQAVKVGVIEIVDSRGVFENHTDVHYDILIESEKTLYKHVIETDVLRKQETTV